LFNGPGIFYRPSSTKLKKHGRPSFKFSGKIKLKEKVGDLHPQSLRNMADPASSFLGK